MSHFFHYFGYLWVHMEISNTTSASGKCPKRKKTLLQHLNHHNPAQMIVFVLYLMHVEYYFIVMT